MSDCILNSCSFKKCIFNCTRILKSEVDAYFGESRLNIDFTGSDLSDIYISDCNTSSMNLSQTTGIKKPKEFMNENFEKDEKGWIVYKGFGYEYPPNPNWVIQPGSYIEETVNPDRSNTCGCGINFATIKWIDENYRHAQIWKCRVEFEDACGIIVPYETSGKARCDRLQIIEMID